MGIAADQAERVFEPFVQVSQDLTRTQGGSGLGLAIARQLARMMGGDLTLASEAGRGSAFTLWLPGVASAASALAEVPADREYEGLSELARVLLSEREAIMKGYETGLRADPAVPRAYQETELMLQNHAVNFLSGVAHHLSALGESPQTASAMARDTETIQRTIAERHGSQRGRMGWSEDALRRDWWIFREEIEGAMRRTPVNGAGLAHALAVVARMFERAERTSIRTWHLAAADRRA